TGGQAAGAMAVALGGADPSQFEITSDACMARTLSASATCQIVARFRPGAQAAGAKSATLTVAATPGGTAVNALTGTAQTPAALPLTGSGAFGDVIIGTPATRTITVTNTGQQTTSAITITAPATGFSVLTGMTGDCVSGATTLTSGATCAIRVQFAPTVSGA